MTPNSCPLCEHVNPAKSKFCNACGSPLPMAACLRCGEMNDLAALECAGCGSALPGSLRQASADAAGLRRGDAYAQWAIAAPDSGPSEADRVESHAATPLQAADDPDHAQRRALIDRLLAPAEPAGFRTPAPDLRPRLEPQPAPLRSSADGGPTPERFRPEPAVAAPGRTDMPSPAAHRSPWLTFGPPGAILALAAFWLYRSMAPEPAPASAVTARPALVAPARRSASGTVEAGAAVAQAVQQMASAPPAAGAAPALELPSRDVDLATGRAPAPAPARAAAVASVAPGAAVQIASPPASPPAPAPLSAPFSVSEPERVVSAPAHVPPVAAVARAPAAPAVTGPRMAVEPLSQAGPASPARPRVQPTPPAAVAARTLRPTAGEVPSPGRTAPAVDGPCTRAIAALGLCTLESPASPAPVAAPGASALPTAALPPATAVAPAATGAPAAPASPAAPPADSNFRRP